MLRERLFPGLALQMTGRLVTHFVVVTMPYTVFDRQVKRVVLAKLKFAASSLKKDRR